MITKAKAAGIDELLRIPDVLTMLCVLHVDENESLPETKTAIVWEIIQMYRERAKEKEHDITDEMLLVLGEVSWGALQKDTH